MENVILFGALGIMVVFMFMNNKKRKKAAEDLQTSIKVGSFVMLTSGIYGTVAGFEDEKVVLQTAPGSKLLVNKLAIRQVEAAKPAVVKAEATKPVVAKKTAVAAAKKPAAKKPVAAKKPAAKKPAAKKTSK
jgi:preprotein translocase YajC subunit